MGAQPLRAAVASMAIACALAGGYAYNDLRDQDCDRLNRPGRPLVCGRLSPRAVKRIVVVAFAAAMLLAIATGSLATAVFVSLLIASACLYSDGIKHTPGLKNAFVALWCGLLPWGASVERMRWSVMPAVAIVALFVMQKELIADLYDREGDAAAGIATIPVMMGSRIALALVALLNVALWLFVRAAPAPDALPYLHMAAQMAASINALSLCAVFVRTTSVTVRAYLELQKVFQIGGCIGLFAATMR